MLLFSARESHIIGDFEKEESRRSYYLIASFYQARYHKGEEPTHWRLLIFIGLVRIARTCECPNDREVT